MTLETNRFRELLAGDSPAVVVTFSDDPAPEVVDATLRQGVDVVELRLDRFGSHDPGHIAAQIDRYPSVPVIATMRAATEGGEGDASPEERAAVYRVALGRVDAIDVELASVENEPVLARVIAEARASGTVVLLSHHDFLDTPAPDVLDDLTHRARAQGADVVKVAAMASSHHDLRTLAAFTIRHPDTDLCVIAMGDHGSQSRIFFPALGSRLAYAHAGRPVPGQLDVSRTVELLQEFHPEFRSRHLGGTPPTA